MCVRRVRPVHAATKVRVLVDVLVDGGRNLLGTALGIIVGLLRVEMHKHERRPEIASEVERASRTVEVRSGPPRQLHGAAHPAHPEFVQASLDVGLQSVEHAGSLSPELLSALAIADDADRKSVVWGKSVDLG